ncbi:MAG: conjugative transfer ATPase [Burkholderiales bacterium]|jgi:conjugative transfer ATPase|nr:conjugative transfer ATPase [Burkholderiales bacterium]
MSEALIQALKGLPSDAWNSLTGKTVRAETAKAPPSPPERPHWRSPNQPRATKADQAKINEHHPGFCDFLPWVEYLPESQCFLLEDNRSVGAVFELIPIGTEGREADWLMGIRDVIENALQDAFDEFEEAPWILQFFCQDDSDFAVYMRNLNEYVKSSAKKSDFTEEFLNLTNHHMRAIAKPGGLFRDARVTKQPWRGQNRRVRMVLYRRLSDRTKLDLSPEQELNHACERIVGSLRGAGVEIDRVDGRGFYEWMLPWFNPKPTMTGDKPIDFYPKVPYWDDDGAGTDLPLPFSHDFSERLFFSEPRSDVEKGTWYFDGMAHKVVVVDKLRRAPKIGHTTGEIKKGDAFNAMFDRLPEDTVMVITMVIKPQDILEGHLLRLKKKSIGENEDSKRTIEDAEVAQSLLGRSHKLYRGTIAFFLRGRNEEELHDKHVALSNVLLGEELQPVQEGEEIAACNSYLRWLPMCYNPLDDPKEWYTSFLFAQHVANLAPVWGRAIGTGRPGLSFFNRGGSPITFDPLSKHDRAMNAHMLLFGPTGAGKSATLVTLMCQMMGIYRPRLFIVEAGNSFGLLAQYFSKLGLSVNQVSIKPGVDITLAPFADAKLLIESTDKIEKLVVEEELLPGKDSLSEDDSEKRDVLGELEIIARLMITGGEAKEDDRLTRADRSVIRKGIVSAAELCVKEGRTVMTRDIIAALRRAGQDKELKESRATRIIEMSEAMELYTQGFDGLMFDREGTSWLESDVTLVDLGHYAREGNEAQMSIAYISLINTVNNIAERDQYLGRPIIMVTDEGHIITKNPLVAPYAVKITKMWRKLGAWFWLATQNMADLPGSAATLLNMIEWWINLVMPQAEIEEIARFKRLSSAQKTLLLSASKETAKYTEGVVLSKNHEFLFRAVPPSLYLALAMTEPEEKLERAEIMREKQCSELEAAFWVAEKLDRARGIEPMPWRHLFERGIAA